MDLRQSASQRTIQTMSGQMLASLNILAMSNKELGEHLSEQALVNPAIEYNPPRISAVGGDAFDAVSELSENKPSLHVHLSEQIDLSITDVRERAIAEVFLKALEPTGWLGQDLSAIAKSARIDMAEAEVMLERLQKLDPPGIFARSLGECLTLQAKDLDILTWEFSALLENLPLLAEGRVRELAEICDCEPDDIPDIARPIRNLDPKPGLAFTQDIEPVFPPDLIAKRSPSGWEVELNQSTSPVIRINPAALPDIDTPDSKKFCRAALNQAKSLAQALERRGETLLRTATVLVARQAAFLDRGRRYLKPLSLQDVGDALDLHPSTISRATSGRMIETPNGTLMLKDFFSRATASVHADTVTSQDAALDFVNRTVENEPRFVPFSDEEIAQMANAAGFAIARRTVVKYRKRLGIASSYARRRASAPRLAN
ncbi:MAG: RNA polymerase factor sigma-54 [Pseudomonadota bacterium]